MPRGSNHKTFFRTDASDYGCGAHLIQKEIIGTDELGNEIYGPEKTIQFSSKSFDKTQLNWSTPEKECSAYGMFAKHCNICGRLQVGCC